MKTAGRKEKITACVLMAFSIVYSLGCLKLKVGKIGNPGSGLMPWLIGILMLFFTSINLFRAFRSEKPRNGMELRSEGSESSLSNYRASLGIAASVVAYPFLLHNLKFILATFIVFFFMLYCMKYKKLSSSLVISLTVTVISFVVFSLLLGVTLPGGALEELVFRLW